MRPKRERNRATHLSSSLLPASRRQSHPDSATLVACANNYHKPEGYYHRQDVNSPCNDWQVPAGEGPPAMEEAQQNIGKEDESPAKKTSLTLPHP